MSKTTEDLIFASPSMWDAQRAIPGLKINPYAVPSVEDSGHGVLFGNLDSVGSVVVKPHVQDERAVNEARRIQSVGALGINTPKLRGLYPGNLASYLVTDEYPGLRTLVKEDLKLGIADPKLNRSLAPTITAASEGAAELHAKGVIHGDYQAKNAAVGPAGEFVAIDLEKAQINTQGERGEMGRAKDLYLLGSSLLLRGLLADRSSGYRAGFLDATVLAPHATAVSAHKGAEVDYDRVSRAFDHTAKTGKIVTVSKI